MLVGDDDAPVPHPDDHQMVAVGPAQDILPKHFSGRPVRDQLPVQAQDLVEPLNHAIQVVGGHDDCFPVVPEFFKQSKDGVLCGDVHATDRLVQEEQVRVLSQDTSQEGPLLLPARQFADLGPSMVQKVHAFQGPTHGCEILWARAATPADPRVPAHHHHIRDRDRKIPVDLLQLGEVTHHCSLSQRGRLVKQDLAALVGGQSQDGLEEGGLPGAVGTDYTDHLSRRYGKGDPIQRGRPIVTRNQVPHLQAVSPTLLLCHRFPSPSPDP
jgi:hypothetical protein